ncbi:hypothetical protein J3A83DRAFT_3492558 [Scleroderma citrinum]
MNAEVVVQHTTTFQSKYLCGPPQADLVLPPLCIVLWAETNCPCFSPPSCHIVVTNYSARTIPPRTVSPSFSITMTVTTTRSGTDIDLPTTISTFIILTFLSRQHIAASMISALRSDLASLLTTQLLWLVQQVQTFASSCEGSCKRWESRGGGRKESRYVVNDMMREAEERMQELYGVVEAEQRRGV